MARIDHSNCAHPRTPAGRASCRKAGTWQEAAGIKPLTAGKPAETSDVGVDAILLAPAPKKPRKSRGVRVDIPETDGGVDAVLKPRKARSTRAGTTTPGNGRSPRTRALKAEHDLADVPHAFTAVIRWAWKQGFEVRTANPYNDTERRVEIIASQGVGTLVWRHTTPDGINGQFWRPADSSVTSKVSTVNELMRRM